MKIEDVYAVLVKDNFSGDRVLETCLNGTLEKGIITTHIRTGYFSDMHILGIGTVYIDHIRIEKGVLHGLNSNKKLVYSIPLDEIETFVISSGLDNGKYHRPVYVMINYCGDIS